MLPRLDAQSPQLLLCAEIVRLSCGRIIGIEERLMSDQYLNPLENFSAAALGHRAPEAGIARLPRQLLGNILDAD